jgi:hypothetical protein
MLLQLPSELLKKLYGLILQVKIVLFKLRFTLLNKPLMDLVALLLNLLDKTSLLAISISHLSIPLQEHALVLGRIEYLNEEPCTSHQTLLWVHLQKLDWNVSSYFLFNEIAAPYELQQHDCQCLSDLLLVASTRDDIQEE